MIFTIGCFLFFSIILSDMQGVIGVYSMEHAAQKALYLLYGVQHRGQESAGISAAGDNSLRIWKNKGLVSNVFDEQFESFMHPDDYVVVGNASGESTDGGRLTPIKMESERYELSLTMDGFVPGREDELNEEVMGTHILSNLEQEGDVQSAITKAMMELSNAYYSLVICLRDKETGQSELIAARDCRGIRPLYLALNEMDLFLSSESAPIDVMENMGEDIDERRDFAPGVMIIRNEEGLVEKQVFDPQPAHCAFEWVYFGRPDSVIEGRNVHSVRKRLGHALVETHSLRSLYSTLDSPHEDIVVIPVPDSGRSVCVGVAEALGVSADEGVIKNAYLGRTYIIDDPEFRKVASDLKHNIIKEIVKDKKVIITDDSIVRGTVSESVAQNLLKAGAAEVEYLVSYAPIYHPCFSDPEDKPLAAAPYRGKSLEEIGDLVACKLPSIRKVRYNSPENVVRAIGLPESNLCTLCISGKDPFDQD
jgi:amidophosphoribosyltransferase